MGATRELTVVLGEDDVRDLQGMVTVEDDKMDPPRFVVGKKLAAKWADQHAEDIAAALRYPPLILPKSAILEGEERRPFLPTIWRSGDKNRGSEGPLLTWLFMWWLAQSSLGGVNATYPGPRILLQPFVKRLPAIRPKQKRGRTGNRVVWDSGEEQFIELAFAEDRDPRRYLSDSLKSLKDAYFVSGDSGAETLGHPGVVHAVDSSPFQPLVLNDYCRYALAKTENGNELVERFSTSSTWEGSGESVWSGLALRPDGPIEVSLAEMDIQGMRPDPRSLTDVARQKIGSIVGQQPNKGFLYVEWALLKYFPQLEAGQILTLLALSADSPRGILEPGRSLERPSGTSAAARFGLPPDTLQDGLRSLIKKEILTESKKTAVLGDRRTVALNPAIRTLTETSGD